MPGATPIGGGVDGPQYADFIDHTDQQQIAGAATSMREKLVIMQDTLVLDIAKFSGGDIKPQATKAQAPTIAPYITLRSTGALESTTRSIEQFEAEFMRFVEQMPPKLRMMLLKNMNLPKDQRNPELDGLENAIKQQIEVRLWAKTLLRRFRGQKEKDEEEKERKGVFSLEEEEELIPEGTLIPETRYVPIALVDPYNMTEDEICKQFQANGVFVAQCHLSLLELQIAQLAVDDPARPLLNSFPTLIKRMIQHSKAFVNLVSFMGYEKAKKAAKGVEKLGLTLVEEQRLLLEKAARYSAGSPARNLVAFSMAILGVTVVSCNILRSDASLAAYNTQGASFLHALLLQSASYIDPSILSLFDAFGRALEILGLDIRHTKMLQLTTFVTTLIIPLLTAKETLPYLAAFIPELAQGLSTAFKKVDRKREKAAKELQDIAKSIAIQLSIATQTALEIAPEAVQTLIETESPAICTLTKFALLFVTRLLGHNLLDRIGGGGSEIFLTLTEDLFYQLANQLQELADNGAVNSVTAETIDELRLSELAYQGEQLSQQILSRDKTLARLGIPAKTIREASQQLLHLVGALAISLNQEQKQLSQIVPTVNVIA